jgi:hypothetical protein
MPIFLNGIPQGSTFTQQVVFTQFIERNTRQLTEHIHGTFTKMADAQALNSGAPIAWTHGIGKILFVINAGGDFDGSLTVTGTSVDRNTGAETGADTEEIAIDVLTTDDSDTDAEGNARHAFTGAYITSKWFIGSISVTTTDLTLTDVDVWAVSFEQINDTPNLTLQTFNTSLDVTNTAAWYYAYLYTLIVTTATKKCNITRSASLELAVGVSEVKPYRLRKGDLDVSVDGSKDGFWYEIFFGPNNQSYFQDVTIDVWFDMTQNTN